MTNTRFNPEIFTGSFQSWEKRLNSKQFKVQRKGDKYVEVVTRSFFNKQKGRPEFVPLNARIRDGK